MLELKLQVLSFCFDKLMVGMYQRIGHTAKLVAQHSMEFVLLSSKDSILIRATHEIDEQKVKSGQNSAILG